MSVFALQCTLARSESQFSHSPLVTMTLAHLCGVITSAGHTFIQDPFPVHIHSHHSYVFPPLSLKCISHMPKRLFVLHDRLVLFPLCAQEHKPNFKTYLSLQQDIMKK